MADKTLLIVGAHHDDGEYAAGGLILKAVAKGYRVVLVTLTGDHASWAPTANRVKDVRQGLLDLAREMGVEKRFYDWGYHDLRYGDPGIGMMSELALELKPTLALIHWPYDYWPDHEAAGKLARHALWFPNKAFLGRGAEIKPQHLLAFEAGPNQVDSAVPFRPDVYVDVTDVMDRAAYFVHRIDEIVSGQTYPGQTVHEMDKRGKSRQRGGECGVMYAEAFVALRKIPQDIL